MMTRALILGMHDLPQRYPTSVSIIRRFEELMEANRG